MILPIIIASLVLFIQPVTAETVASITNAGTKLSITLSNDYFNVNTRVTGPDNYLAEGNTKGNTLVLELTSYGSLTDGNYYYEITAASHQLIDATTGSDTGKNDYQVQDYINTGYRNKGVSQSGTFQVINGGIVFPEITSEGVPSDNDQ